MGDDFPFLRLLSFVFSFPLSPPPFYCFLSFSVVLSLSVPFVLIVVFYLFVFVDVVFDLQRLGVGFFKFREVRPKKSLIKHCLFEVLACHASGKERFQFVNIYKSEHFTGLGLFDATTGE